MENLEYFKCRRNKFTSIKAFGNHTFEIQERIITKDSVGSFIEANKLTINDQIKITIKKV